MADRARRKDHLPGGAGFCRAILNAMSAHVAIVDQQGTIVAVNEAWERFARENASCSSSLLSVGASYVQTCKRSSSEGCKSADAALNGICEVLDGTRARFTLEYPCHSPTAERWFLLDAAPLPPPFGGAVISHVCITDRVRAEEERRALAREREAAHEQLETVNEALWSMNQQLEAANEELRRQRRELERASQAKDQFLSMLAHELRNPLAPIRTALHVLRRSQSDTPAWKRSNETIERQIQHMAHLTNDLLDVTRLASGKIRLRRERVDLIRIVRESCEDHRPAVEAAGLELALELPRRPLWVRADRTRMAQILDNLLDNAVKFTQAGGRITVRIREDRESHVAAVSVVDTGIGIAPEMLPHIFEPLTQADRSLDRSSGGLGLGLAVVKGLMALHRGDVRAYSAGPGRGAEFTFMLPRDTEPDSFPVVTADAGEERRPLRVLVVEDSRDAADTLKDLLDLAGYQVEVAYSGAEGVERARAIGPDVVLCDLGLPGMDGYAVASALRQDPATASTRLIAITGYGGAEDRHRARAAGFDLHLVKPVDPAALQQILARLPERR